MEILNSYIDRLLSESTPDKPIWNIERINNGKMPSWNYIDGCMLTALLEIYKVTKEEKYFDFVKTFIDYYVSDVGVIKGYLLEEFNLDNINEGRVLFDLYEITGEKKYKLAIDNLYRQIQTQPRTNENNFWHKKIYPNQVWLDGIYMAQPFYLRYETSFTKHEHYRDILNQIINVREKMFNKDKGLYHHGYDSSKEIFWADKETGLSKNFWLRATGWYVVALVDILDYMNDELFYMYRTLRNQLKEAIDGLLKYQDESGMWYQIIDCADLDNNYLETSGSSMIAYAILKAVRLGILPNKYLVYGKNAFNGITKKYLSEVDGKLHLGGICLMAGLGPDTKRNRDGSKEYYLSEPIVENDAKGVAPLVLAYTEIIRLMDK